jgi:Helix-turn-helix domain
VAISALRASATPGAAPIWTTLHLAPATWAADIEAGASIVAEGERERDDPFLNTAEAASWLRLTKNTLEKMRVQGRGPPYRKHGRYVRYHIEDLVEWSHANKRSSTSDAD